MKVPPPPRGETAESLTFKITRLRKINLLLESMRDVRPVLVHSNGRSTHSQGICSISVSDTDFERAEVDPTHLGGAFFEAQERLKVISAEWYVTFCASDRTFSICSYF